MNTPKCNHLTLLHFKGLTTARLLGDQILNTALGLVRDQSKEGNQKVVHVKSRLNHWFIGFFEWWMQNFNLSALTSQRILPSVKAMLREITTRKSSIYWTSNVTSVTEVRSVSARLLVHGTPWWVLLQHSIMLRLFFIIECGIEVRATTSPAMLPLCQI